ncbi:MAG TPA: hypothetical protein VGH50_20835 [Candidatus Binatia bacterium]|jgi:hypothetical protein
MEVLDEFPPWTIYLLAFIVACGFSLSSIILYRSWSESYTARHRLDQYRLRPNRKLPLFSGSALFFSIAGALALWFFFTSMFLCFHAMEIGSDHLDLIYFWPRPQEIIRRADLLEVKFVPSHRSCGYFVVSTKESVFKSVSFKHCDVAEEILHKLTREWNMSAQP